MKVLSNFGLLLCIVLGSCTEIYFAQPQPKGVKTFDTGMEELIGTYIGIDEDSSPESSDSADTIRVSSNNITFSDGESSKEDFGEQIVVKKYRGHYFINFYIEEKGLWQLIVAKSDGMEGFDVVNMTSLDKDKSEALTKEKYSKKVEPEEKDAYIVMDPPRRKLMRLIEYPIFNENKLHLDKIKTN